MITGKKTLYTACFILAGLNASAQADETSSQDGIVLGLGAQSAPKYSGSDEQHWQTVPVVQARKGAFFFDSQKGLGYDLQSENGLYFEHTLGYGLGRADNDSDWRDGSDKLKGMGSIKATLNTGVAAGWAATSWLAFEAKAVLPLTDSQGVNYRASVTFIPVQTSDDNVSVQAAALFGDSRYMRTWYGVNMTQAKRSGYDRYAAAAGFYGVDTNVTWSHQFTSHWGGALIGSYTWLNDHAADSPIVFRHNEVSGAVAVTYSF